MSAFIIFLNGLCIMVLEMVGARLLAPWLGTSIIVWTSLIGIILTCLSIGYWLGGKAADACLTNAGTAAKVDPSTKVANASSLLSKLLAGAAFFTCVTALSQSLLLEYLTILHMPLHLTAIVATLLLFAGPSLLCGMISPFTVRLSITNQEHAGSIIGKLNAIGTIGSIIGTFLGGFILISWFGSREIFFGIAATFLFGSLVVAKKGFLLHAFIAIPIISGLWGQFIPSPQQSTIETPYNTIQIVDGGMYGRPARFLITDPGSYQSGTYLDSPKELLFPYTQFYPLATWLNPKAQRILMLGGGGYSVPKWLLSDNSYLATNQFSLDVIELDPGMTKVSQSFFFLPEDDPRLRIFHEDARSFLNHTMLQNTTEQPIYDLIFADVFNSYYSVPFHIGTQEAAMRMHALLAEDGLVMMNIITAIEGDNGRLFRGIYHAFATIFPYVQVFPVHQPNDGTAVQNVMLIATKKDLWQDNQAIRAMPDTLRRQYRHLWAKPIPTDVPPLRDNFAPVERYTLGQLQK